MDVRADVIDIIKDSLNAVMVDMMIADTVNLDKPSHGCASAYPNFRYQNVELIFSS